MQRIDELRHRALELARKRECAEDLVAEIRRDIRAARGDSATVTQLRILLGDVFYWTSEPAKSRAQYRRALKDDPDSIEAMIGIGHSFGQTERLTIAKKWFEAAYLAAERTQDAAGKLRALDVIAFTADLRGDDAALLNALDEMCRIVATAPPIPDLHLMIAEGLLVKGRGAVTLPLLECIITHMLEKGYSRGPFFLVLRPFIQIHRQENRSEEEISEVLGKLRLTASDESVAKDFDIATGWALKRSNYAYLDGAGAPPSDE